MEGLLGIKVHFSLRKKLLVGAIFLLAAGCTPAASGAALSPNTAPSMQITAPQPFTPRPVAGITLSPVPTSTVSELDTDLPLLQTQVPSPTLAPSKTVTAAPTMESLSSRLWEVFTSTPPRDYLGNPDFYSAEPDLVEFDCFSGKNEPEQQACLKEAGLYYYDLYQDLPYMWGGNYPYSYSAAAAFKAAGDPFLNLRPINIAPVEEDRFFAGFYQGRSGMPMKAGFDCSGFTFWIMAHAGQPDFLAGKCSDPALAEKNYYRCDSPQQMQAGWVIPEIGDGRVSIRTILQYGQPGDLIFTEDHVMFYLGGGEVVQSVDVELIGGDYSRPPADAWLGEWLGLHPELKLVQRGGVNRTTLEHMGSSFWIRRYTILETR